MRLTRSWLFTVRQIGSEDNLRAHDNAHGKCRANDAGDGQSSSSTFSKRVPVPLAQVFMGGMNGLPLGSRN